MLVAVNKARIMFLGYLLDFDNNISLILDLWYWSVLDDNFARPLEDYSFHGIVAHDE